MDRSTHIACMATVFTTILAGGIDESLAQPARGEEGYSLGTQGLQEKLYEERIRELQQNQSKSSAELQGRDGQGSSGGQSSQSGAPGGRVQEKSDGRPGDAGAGSGRQTDQQRNR
jgi:hypothetical protein